MSSHHPLANLFRSEQKLFALCVPGGPLLIHKILGENRAETSLIFQKFHQPRGKKPSAWGDFPDFATWGCATPLEFPESAWLQTKAPAPPVAEAQQSRTEWEELCARASSEIQAGALSKVVLSREIAFSLCKEEYEKYLEEIPLRLFFRPLAGVFRFAIKCDAGLFFGASPELLFQRRSGRIFVPAIAGTRPLGSEKSESEARAELLSSPKERAEHDFVVGGIKAALARLGMKPEAPVDPEPIRVPGLLHLFTPITAKDIPGISSQDILEALHPTPAIGGSPRGPALDFLYQNEGWDRGLFSAPLLFQSTKQELCIVAIRSGLLTANTLRFFAGAGFVRGSTAGGEWLETEKKMRVMQNLLFEENHG